MKRMRLALVCFALLLTILGCGSQAKPSEAAEEMITLTLTSDFIGNTSDEKLEKNVGTLYQSAERQPDGSVVLKMTNDQYADYLETLRQGITSAAQNMVSNSQNNITDITFDDNFSAFQVTVKTDTLQHSGADSAYYMFTALGKFYQYITTGKEDCPVDFTFFNAKGNLLEEACKPE